MGSKVGQWQALLRFEGFVLQLQLKPTAYELR